ncbi:MAG: DUF1361 domain-containing protein [Saprospiraceae bacterium]|nr:DUF1361 domain-containing protein [Saprospiraceae bacterium]
MIANLVLQVKANMRFRLIILLGISMIFSVIMSIFRVWHTETLMYAFLVWNLFLAAIPYGISTLLILYPHLQKRAFIFWSLMVIWLLFLPNAPYIFTDLFHLRPRQDVPLWFDLLLLLSFAWNGLMLGYLSLLDIQEIIIKKISWRSSWILVIGVLLLSAFGVYLGRYLRWNSWDLFLNPLPLFQDIFDRFIHPFAHPRTWGVTFGYGTFLILGYLILRTLIQKPIAKI